MAQQEIIIYWMPTTNAGIFLLCLPFRLWELHNSRFRAVPGAQAWTQLVGQHPLKPLRFCGVDGQRMPGRWNRTLPRLLPQSVLAAPSAVSSPIIPYNITNRSVGLGLAAVHGATSRVQPSDLATLYLLASVLCDLVDLTAPSTGTLRSPQPVGCLLSAVLLALNCFAPPPHPSCTS